MCASNAPPRSTLNAPAPITPPHKTLNAPTPHTPRPHANYPTPPQPAFVGVVAAEPDLDLGVLEAGREVLEAHHRLHTATQLQVCVVVGGGTAGRGRVDEVFRVVGVQGSGIRDGGLGVE